MNFCKEDKNSFIGKEYYQIKNNLHKVLENKRFWGGIVEGVGDINWNVDEATCISLANGNKKQFYNEIESFILSKYSQVDKRVLKDIISYQKNRLSDPNVTYPVKDTYEYNIHNIIENEESLKKEKNTIVFNSKNYNSDIFSWAKEIIWFGRRVGRYKTSAVINSKL